VTQPTTTRVPGDPKPAVKAALLTYFGDEARVAAEVPDDWDLATGGPLLTVYDDGGPLNWPILSLHIVRVTVWGNGQDLVKLIARRAAGFLHDNIPEGLEDIHTTKGTAIITTRDPDTGADLASFTVTATVRTETVNN
jgi:hypothetical protein